jgi:sulfopyruvate decarboxylase subunit beta
MMKRDACLEILDRHITDEIVVAVYSAAAEWLVLNERPLNHYFVGAMGLASSHALGLALGRPDKRVVVLDGDGSLLMNLGTLVTIAAVAPRNLTHFVIHNGTYEANGGHPIPNRERIDIVGLARSAGIPQPVAISDLADFEARLPGLLTRAGPVFAALDVVPGKPPVFDYPALYNVERRRAFQVALDG